MKPADAAPARPAAGEVAAVARTLGREYVPDAPEPSGCPLDELIATILSQHTSDRNSHRAFADLKKTFPSWSRAVAAGRGAIAAAIRAGGLANQKAAWIEQLLACLPRDEAGEPTLHYLAAMTESAAYQHLQEFAGIGPKTAACTLLFAYGWPVFPVDVHVHRVARRLGWAGARESAEGTQTRLMALVPPEDVWQLHMGMVRHGRQLCRPSNPGCQGCPVQDHCLYWQDAAARAAAAEGKAAEYQESTWQDSDSTAPEVGRDQR